MIKKIKIKKENWVNLTQQQRENFVKDMLGGVKAENIETEDTEYSEIEISEEAYKKAEEGAKKLNISPDKFVELALKEHINNEENKIMNSDSYKEAVEPFERLKRTVSLNRNMLLKETGDYSAYQKYQQLVLLQYDAFIDEKGFFKDDFDDKKSKDVDDSRIFPLFNQVRETLTNSKIFNINKELQEMIENTDNKIYFRKTPFDNFFINVEFEFIKDIRIYGVSVIKMSAVYNITSKKTGEALFVTLMGRDFRDDSEFYAYFSIDAEGISEDDKISEKIKKEIFDKNEIEKMEEQISKFICTFLDLLNHPDIEYEVVKHPEDLNENRYRKGKTRVADKINVYVKGKLYKYIYEDMPRIRKTYRFSYWVRGHYMHFRDTNTFVQIYKLTEDKLKERNLQKEDNLIKKWVKPFLKGKGKIAQKEYAMNIKNE
jgi:hypothetical protein